MENSKKTRKVQGLTVGARILLGVALASNIVIGSMLYLNLQANATVERIVNDVLVIREELNDHLRLAIVELQNEFLSLPGLFSGNEREAVLATIDHEFQTVGNEVLSGRENYQQYYSRKERRDLANNGFVVQSAADGVYLSYGILDAAGAFTDTVARRHLASANPTEDAARLGAAIAASAEQALSPEELRHRIRELSRRSADIGIKAELTRNEILYTVDEISAKERLLAETRTRVRHFTLGIGVLAIIANMAILFVLVRLLVERPLHRLAQSLEDLSSGNLAEVPSGNRRDQLGVLSEAIGHFRGVLIELQSDNLRKTREKSVVDDLVERIAGVIHTLEGRARELVEMSMRLSDQATVVESPSGGVQPNSGIAVDQAGNCPESPLSRSGARSEARQIEDRQTAVREILDNSGQSCAIAGRIALSIDKINEAIAVVREIAEQTQSLAMNATIQAERNGDANWKLGAFANEIWELSFNTSHAAKLAMAAVEDMERENAVLTGTLHRIDSRVLAMQGGAIEIRHVAAAGSRDLSRQVCRHASEIATQLASLLHETTTRLQQLGKKQDLPQFTAFTLALDQAGGKA